MRWGQRQVLLALALAASAVQASAAASDARTTRVLCYGDSLTAGFWSGGHAFHPYATQLSRRLGGCAVDHIGLSGYTSAQMAATLGGNTTEGDVDATRQRWATLDEALERTAYTHVVVLAGTNDLSRLRHAGGPRSAADVVDDVAALHKRALASGAQTLALTVPQPAFEGVRPQMAAGRAEINAGLRDFAAAKERVTLPDLEPLLPHLNATAEERARLWDDGLHLTPAGYDTLGDAVADALLEAGGATPCGGSSASGEALQLHRIMR